MARTWSAQQNAIFAATLETSDNLVVRARAGTGKTTTITEAVVRLHAATQKRIVVCAFNKKIAEELQKRFAGTTVDAKTLHSIGLACVKRFWPDVKVSFGSERADGLAERVCGPTAPDAIKRLVSKLHTKGREIAPHATALGDLTEIALRFECDPDEGWAEDGFGLEYVESKALAAMQLAAEIKPQMTGIDGSDMIFLPVRNKWLRPSWDVVVVDEAQDMTVAQLEIAQGVSKGRVIVVGDDRQAIYGFRGADSDSLDRLKTALHSTELPLTTTYRCGRAIVNAAAYYVPDFQAGPDNPEGEILSLSSDKLTATAGPGDFILSRVNAPLVSVAMSLLRAGKRTRIAGRDIGKGLTGLLRKLKARSVPDMLAKLDAWRQREIARITKQYASRLDSAAYTARIEGVNDQADMLGDLADGAKSIDDVIARVEALFTDDGLGDAGVITCSSVHRSKGLEADRVFILKNTLRASGDREEENIAYVAITRAKNTLVWVTQ